MLRFTAAAQTGGYISFSGGQSGDCHHLQTKRVVCTECHEGDFNAGTPATVRHEGAEGEAEMAT